MNERANESLGFHTGANGCEKGCDTHQRRGIIANWKSDERAERESATFAHIYLLCKRRNLLF